MGKEVVGRVSQEAMTSAKTYYSGKKSSQNRDSKPHSAHGVRDDAAHVPAMAPKFAACGKRQGFVCKHWRTIAFVVGLMGSFFLFDWLMLTVIRHVIPSGGSGVSKFRGSQDGESRYIEEDKPPMVMYKRLMALASVVVAKDEVHRDQSLLWEEPLKEAYTWKPCADRNNSFQQGDETKRTGFILVSANGGLNQQRVAVCNAVSVAALLNATLVIPKFLYSNVWKDPSQFGDLYQEDYFINFLKDDVNIVKELPRHLQNVDFERIGSEITDAEIRKESEPKYFLKAVLPLLQKNGVVHFLGFGNRLGFDPMPLNLQRLRCKCNFHALKFIPRIQETGSLLVRRIRKDDSKLTHLDRQLLGKYMPDSPLIGHNISRQPFKYLALHMRFEMDMVAYSLCDFGGGEREREELQAYREIHFPTLVMQMRNNKTLSPAQLRDLGRCPLTPEEAGLMLSALGYKPGTYIYLAGSHIYGGQSRVLPFTGLYPNLVTKEDLLTPSELAPFKNFSSQLAALDLIACATSDVFAMTDTGSQFASLVTGFRAYHGRGRAPTLRPDTKRYAKILSDNRTVAWNRFADRVRKMIEEGQRVRARGRSRSIYRQPRTPGCMCKS